MAMRRTYALRTCGEVLDYFLKAREIEGIERSAKLIPVSISFRAFKNRSYKS